MALNLPAEGRMKAVAEYMYQSFGSKRYEKSLLLSSINEQFLFNCARHGNFYLETERVIFGLREKSSGSVRVLGYLGARREFSFEVSIVSIISEK